MRNPFVNSVRTEFIRYLIVGGLAFAGDFSTLALLHNSLGMQYLSATLLGFLIGMAINYQLSIHWVFSYRNIRQQHTEFMLFMIIGVVTMGVSIGLMALLVSSLGLYVLLAKCFTTGFTLIANFALRRVLLFTRRQNQMIGISETIISTSGFKPLDSQK